MGGLSGLIELGLENNEYLPASCDEIVYEEFINGDCDAGDDNLEDDGACDLPSITEFLELVASYGDDLLDRTRGMFEGCGQGRKVAATNPNRRLYAVLKPNRHENIERIRQFLCSLTVGQLQEVLMAVTAKLRECYPEEEACDE